MEHKFTVLESQSGQRLDKLLGILLAEKTTRSQLKKNGVFLLETEGGWKECSTKTKVQTGQNWKITWFESALKVEDVIPWEVELSVLYEEPDFFLIDKPVGVSIHPSESEKSTKTVVNALVHKFGANFSDTFEEGTVRPGIVHRLDKVTSGVLLIAKNVETLRFFQKNWHTETEKIYYAVVKGTTPVRGSIKAAIMRDPQNRQRMMVSDSPKARPAHTDFKRVAQTQDCKHSLLEVKIYTGRTHQVRVHLSAIGFAIVGDERYKGESADRVYLHASSLSFPHPKTGEKQKVVAPFPVEFRNKFPNFEV